MCRRVRMRVHMHTRACLLMWVRGVMFLIINAVEQALALQIKDIFLFLIALNNCDRTGE